MKLLPVMMSVTLIFLLIVLSFFDSINWFVFVLIFFYLAYLGLAFLVTDMYITANESKEEQLISQKKSIPYMWNKINKILVSMPGGRSVRWGDGTDQRFGTKTFTNGKTTLEIRVVRTRFYHMNQTVLIYYDIDNENIVDFITKPATNKLINPWSGFSPFDKSSSLQGSGMMHPYSKKSNRNRFVIPVESQDSSFDGEDDITVEQNKALENLRG